MLSAMKYKSYVWPNNPTTFSAEYTKGLRSYKFPFSGFCVQDMGKSARVFKGEGEFAGADAYDSFRRLAEVFSDGGSGWLEHPVWAPVKVYFSKLSLLQSPCEEYVKYSFEFIEASDSTSLSGFTETASDGDHVKYTQARSGDTAAAVALRYGMSVSDLEYLNPQLEHGAALTAGQIIRIS